MAFDFSAFAQCQLSQVPGVATNSVCGPATGNCLPICTYSTNDNIAVYRAVDYFLSVKGFLPVGSWILVSGGDGNHILAVTVSGASVQTVTII